MCCNYPLFLPLLFFLYDGGRPFSFYIARKSIMPIAALFISFLYSVVLEIISSFGLT